MGTLIVSMMERQVTKPYLPLPYWVNSGDPEIEGKDYQLFRILGPSPRSSLTIRGEDRQGIMLDDIPTINHGKPRGVPQHDQYFASTEWHQTAEYHTGEYSGWVTLEELQSWYEHNGQWFLKLPRATKEAFVDLKLQMEMVARWYHKSPTEVRLVFTYI